MTLHGTEETGATSTVVIVVLCVLAAALVAQWSTWRGLKRIQVATIVRERSL